MLNNASFGINPLLYNSFLVLCFNNIFLKAKTYTFGGRCIHKMKLCPKCKSRTRIVHRDDYWQMICLNCELETKKFENKRDLSLYWKKTNASHHVPHF